MTINVELTIDRTSLELEPLVIGCECPARGSGGYWIGVNPSRPSFVPRYIYAPDSKFVPGKTLLAATADQGIITQTIYCKAYDRAGLQVLKTALEVALWQFTYTVTFNDDGISTAFDADPIIPVWNPWDPVAERVPSAFTQIAIPVNPVGAP